MYKTSVYTLVNGNIEELAHRKTAKITKGDIARITLTVCQFLLYPQNCHINKETNIACIIRLI